MVRRHPDVHDYQLWLPLPNERDELRCVAALPGHSKARVLEQARKTLAEEDVIVSQRDSNGSLGHLTIIGRQRADAYSPACAVPEMQVRSRVPPPGTYRALQLGLMAVPA